MSAASARTPVPRKSGEESRQARPSERTSAIRASSVLSGRLPECLAVVGAADAGLPGEPPVDLGEQLVPIDLVVGMGHEVRLRALPLRSTPADVDGEPLLLQRGRRNWV